MDRCRPICPMTIFEFIELIDVNKATNVALKKVMYPGQGMRHLPGSRNQPLGVGEAQNRQFQFSSQSAYEMGFAHACGTDDQGIEAWSQSTIGPIHFKKGPGYFEQGGKG